jgi:methylated-DNA-[protein]-cysteine S-methyltransferase
MQEPDSIHVFSTGLGWMAIRGRADRLVALAFQHASASDAAADVTARLAAPARRAPWGEALAERLQRYATGEIVDFDDLPLTISATSLFQRRVLELCRQIPYGETRTYGQLAAAAGSPGAARAVGNCMAGNLLPLVIPCHRVVPSGGKLGSFSAPGGVQTKRRLLEMEAAASLATSAVASSQLSLP